MSENSSKRAHWKPDAPQLMFLRPFFVENRYPNMEEKQAILNAHNKRFNLNIKMSELTDWFQKERTKLSRKRLEKRQNNRIYKKFSRKELVVISQAFEKNMYPSLQDMMKTAESFGVKLNKIENWYKHSRRNLAKEGRISIKQRQSFGREDLRYVMKKFGEDALPSKKKLITMAKELNCDVAQVKNWFANRRKKMKLEGKDKYEVSTEGSDMKEFEENSHREADEGLILNNRKISSDHISQSCSNLSFSFNKEDKIMLPTYNTIDPVVFMEEFQRQTNSIISNKNLNHHFMNTGNALLFSQYQNQYLYKNSQVNQLPADYLHYNTFNANIDFIDYCMVNKMVNYDALYKQNHYLTNYMDIKLVNGFQLPVNPRFISEQGVNFNYKSTGYLNQNTTATQTSLMNYF